jgi:propionate CoA-transferase
MVLTEIAPGIDLRHDILDNMDFTPIIPEDGPKRMRPDIFKGEF